MRVAAEQLIERIEAWDETVYAAGSSVPRHDHRPVERAIMGTPEYLLIRKGRTEVTLCDRERREIGRRLLEQGDLILLVAGGHGFRQLEDTVFLEIKQGPYPGVDEKERF